MKLAGDYTFDDLKKTMLGSFGTSINKTVNGTKYLQVFLFDLKFCFFYASEEPYWTLSRETSENGQIYYKLLMTSKIVN